MTTEKKWYELAFERCFRVEYKAETAHVWLDTCALVLYDEACEYVRRRVGRVDSPWQKVGENEYVRNPMKSIA